MECVVTSPYLYYSNIHISTVAIPFEIEFTTSVWDRMDWWAVTVFKFTHLYKYTYDSYSIDLPTMMF